MLLKKTIDYSKESRPLGTAGAVKCAKRLSPAGFRFRGHECRDPRSAAPLARVIVQELRRPALAGIERLTDLEDAPGLQEYRILAGRNSQKR
jgi:hypothetical protein